MDDERVWQRAVERLKVLAGGLHGDALIQVRQLVVEYRSTKEQFAAVIDKTGAASDCSECRGQCCLNGKYRMNVLDLFVHILTGTVPFVDFNRKPVCPYGSGDGCGMVPEFRPADCILFYCDVIDRKLSPQAAADIAGLEEKLRLCAARMSVITGIRMNVPLLIWGERDADSEVNA